MQVIGSRQTSEVTEDLGSRGQLIRPQLSRTPFVPADPLRRAEHSREIFSIQSTALAKRLKHTGLRYVTIGVSGGFNSTLALLVTAKAFDILDLPRTGIVAITMPGFGTTERTRDNAVQLAEALGVTLRTISIVDAVRQHFHDIGHDETLHDVTYENAQARERTQILMDVANQVGGLVVGTGDLSELALGWATYNGDHMSMYHVNAGVPKTLVRYLVEWAAEAEFSGGTPMCCTTSARHQSRRSFSPWRARRLEQKTEDTIGPYVLHDFFLYYTVRYSFAPTKVFVLARQAFADDFSSEVIVLDGCFLPALFHPTVQAFGHAGRAKGRLGGPVAARRLAHAQRRQQLRSGWQKWRSAAKPEYGKKQARQQLLRR